MSNQRYTPEFKDEAVRQVLERGHTVPAVAERLGVFAHSLYKVGQRGKTQRSRVAGQRTD